MKKINQLRFRSAPFSLRSEGRVLGKSWVSSSRLRRLDQIKFFLNAAQCYTSNRLIPGRIKGLNKSSDRM